MRKVISACVSKLLEKVKSFPMSNEERLKIVGGEANFLLLQRKYQQLLQLAQTIHR